MQLVELHIGQKQAAFSRHPFFSKLNTDLALDEALSFAPDLAFWVMSFQDILRLNALLTHDSKIRRIVRHHRAEDAGHERWFLEDLAVLKLQAPKLERLFGKEHTPTRDAAYALVSEVFRASDDRLRLVLVKVLESAGHVFFGQVSEIVERAGKTSALKYFSFSHLEVEKNHEVFEKQISAEVSAMVLGPELRLEAEQLVDRCYDAFRSMFDALGGDQSRSFRKAAVLSGHAPAVRVRSR